MAYNTVSDTGSLAGLAKEIYPIEEIKDMEQRVTALRKEIEDDNNLKFSAKNDGTFIFPVKASGAHGQKMMNQHEALPKGKPSSIVQGTAIIKEYGGVIEFTKRELELARKNPATFADAKTFEMESLIENAHKYFNRQVANGNGRGVMTTVSGAQSAVTVIPVLDSTPFQIGMVLDIWNVAETIKQADSIVIVDIDLGVTGNAMSFTVSTPDAVTCDATAHICLAGVLDNATSDGKEMIGLPMVVDDGTLFTSFQGIVRSGAGAVPNYRGLHIDAVNGPLSVALIAQMMSRAFRVAGVQFEQMKDVYWAISPEQWRVYAAQAIPQIRFVPNDPMDLAKSYGEPVHEIAGKRAVLDTDVDRRSAYLIKKDSLKMGIATPLDWEADLGGTTLKWLSGYAQGIMLLYSLQQMFSSAPREIIAAQNLATVAI